MNKQREIELDILRIIALLAVISVHCTGMGNTDAMPMSDPAKRVLVFFDSIVTWQIPVCVHRVGCRLSALLHCVGYI